LRGRESPAVGEDTVLLCSRRSQFFTITRRVVEKKVVHPRPSARIPTGEKREGGGADGGGKKSALKAA